MQLEPVGTYCADFAKKYSKKHRTFSSDYKAATKLLVLHLCGRHKEKPVSDKKLRLIHANSDFEIWKYNVVTTGLRPGQWPRMWLGVSYELDLIVPLVIDSHVNNYSDNAHEASAIELMKTYCESNLAN